MAGRLTFGVIAIGQQRRVDMPDCLSSYEKSMSTPLICVTCAVSHPCRRVPALAHAQEGGPRKWFGRACQTCSRAVRTSSFPMIVGSTAVAAVRTASPQATAQSTCTGENGMRGLVVKVWLMIDVLIVS